MSIYWATGIIAMASLALEISFVRLLSVTTWYHLAFFAISTAMLGITAGSVAVYVSPEDPDEDSLRRRMAKACMHYAFAVPFSLAVICVLPMGMYKSFMGLVLAAFTTIACAAPFYFVGIVTSLVLTRGPYAIGKVYAADLLGASLGCLLVLVGLDYLDAPSLIILLSAFGPVSALFYLHGVSGGVSRRMAYAWLIAILVLAPINANTPKGLQPVVIKERIESASAYDIDRWNSFSRIAIYRETVRPPRYWGPSPLAPRTPIRQRHMNIDGDAGTTMLKMDQLSDVDFLKYDVTNIGYYLRKGGRAAVIGVGGGRDCQSALLLGMEHVTGVELNPIFVGVLKNEFKDFVGLEGRPDVDIRVGEARGELSRMEERFDTVQMSLIDTWAATGAGAFTLSENTLYTVEAWQVFLGRLKDDGIYMVSRWHNPGDLDETARLLSLAVASLFEAGATRPSDHLALITSGPISTLLVRRTPFDEADLSTLVAECGRLQYQVTLMPGKDAEAELLRSISTAASPEALAAATQNTRLKLTPPTDESPYFFNMLKLGGLKVAFETDHGVLLGNLTATLTLLALLGSLMIVAVAMIFVPLIVHGGGAAEGHSRSVRWSGAGYFAAIGAAFMFAEIGLIQKLTVLLSHPVYALGILLFTIIAATGVGSFLSEKLTGNVVRTSRIVTVLLVLGIIAMRWLLDLLIANFATETLFVRAASAIAVIAPTGVLMGFFFPTGMRLAQEAKSGDMPWFWSLNGVFGVLCSALAVMVSMFVTISVNFAIAAVIYAITPLLVAHMARQAQGAASPGTAGA